MDHNILSRQLRGNSTTKEKMIKTEIFIKLVDYFKFKKLAQII